MKVLTETFVFIFLLGLANFCFSKECSTRCPSPCNKWKANCKCDGDHCKATCSCSSSGAATPVCDCTSDYIKLSSFTVTPQNNSALIEWKTGIEINNAGFHLWRAIGNNNNELTEITMLGKLNSYQIDCMKGELINTNDPNLLIPAVGSSENGACYSFIDTSITKNGTYYYVLEDINTENRSTFHCDAIQGITINDGPNINPEIARDYCPETTNNLIEKSILLYSQNTKNNSCNIEN